MFGFVKGIKTHTHECNAVEVSISDGINRFIET